MRIRTYWPIVAMAAVVFLVLVAGPAWGQTASAPDPADGPTITGDYGPFMPPDVSKDGHRVDELIGFLHWFMLLLFVGWGIFFVYCLVQFRQRPGHRADPNEIKAKPAKYAEIIVAGIEAVFLLGFSIPIWASVKNELPTEDQNPLRVRVVAEQFQWNFHYPGDDGVFGPTRPEFVNAATNPLGLDLNDPTAADDLYAAELHIPVDRPIICDISSKDVIHSFSIPVMRVKQDAIPGMRIPVWFEAVKTGNYEIACAQLCGNNHYSMRAVLTIHDTEAGFDAWLLTQKPEEFDEDDLD